MLADADAVSGKPGAHSDHGKRRAAGRLEHVKVAVRVSGIKRFNGHGDQEVALSSLADSFAFRSVAGAIGLMQFVGRVVGKAGLFKHPLAIGRSGRSSQRPEVMRRRRWYASYLKLERHREKG